MDGERDLSAWTGNEMQREAMTKIQELEPAIRAADDPELTHVWAKMQTSNHLHWMSTKGGRKQASHSPLIPYPSPAEAHRRHMDVLHVLQSRLRETEAPARA